MARLDPGARAAHLPRPAGGLAGAVVAPLAAAALLFVLLATVPALYVLAAGLVVAGTYAVYRLPVISLSVLVVVGMGPLLFLMTGRFPLSVPVIPGKLSLADAIMVAMLIAVVFRGVTLLGGSRSRVHASAATTALAVSFGLLLVWIGFSIVRNLGPYGIHTVGQFRYSYLVLAVPAYAALFLRTAAQRRRFVVFLLVFSVGVTLAVVPVIGYLKGWSIGAGSRFFPSSVSLGLLYGWAALFIFSERGALPVPRWLARGLALPVAALLVLDSHRSVWLAALVMLAIALLALRAATTTVVRLLALTAAAVVALLAVATLRGFDILGYVAIRGAAIVAPSTGDTSSWRLQLWRANLARWREHPMIADGFGGYYAGNATVGVAQTTMPHSLYVQTLVVLGLVGMVLLLAVVAASAAVLWRSRSATGGAERAPLDAALPAMGLVVLAGALAFWSVYPLDLYSCLWAGVALAAVAGLRGAREGPRTSAPPTGMAPGSDP